MNLRPNIVKWLSTLNSFRNISLIMILALCSVNLFGQLAGITGKISDGLPNSGGHINGEFDRISVLSRPNADRKAGKQIELKVREWEEKSVPSKSLQEKYQSFLKTDRSNIAVIFPDLNCKLLKLGTIVSVEEARRCENAPQLQENGSLYSFRFKRNYIDYYDMKSDKRLNDANWWDLHFNKDRFVVGNCCAQAIIADLGNLDFESQNSSLPNLDYLNNFKAGTTDEEIQTNERVLQTGVKLDGLVYRKTARVNVGHGMLYAQFPTSSEKRKTPPGKISKYYPTKPSSLKSPRYNRTEA